MLVTTILILSLIKLNTIDSSPIQKQIKLCNLDNFTQEFNYELLKGEWYDVVRTKFIYNDKTWINGYSTILVNETSQKFEFSYCGIDSLGKCQNADKIEMFHTQNETHLKGEENSLRVINYTEDLIVIAICFNGSNEKEFCDLNKVDLFVWSRSRSNVTSDVLYLKSYCVGSDDVVYSDLNSSKCIKEDVEEHLIAIAEITSQQNLTDFVSLNSSSNIEINIELDTNKTDLNSTLFVKLIKSLNVTKLENSVSLVTNTTMVSLKNNLTFVPVLTEVKNVTTIDDEKQDNEDQDIMIIGLKKNTDSNSTKFEPVYVEIELGSGDNDQRENLTESFTTQSNEIGLKKLTISVNDNDNNSKNEEVVDDLEVTKENKSEINEDYDKEDLKKLDSFETTTIKEESVEDGIASYIETTTKLIDQAVSNEEIETTGLSETTLVSTTATTVTTTSIKLDNDLVEINQEEETNLKDEEEVDGEEENIREETTEIPKIKIETEQETTTIIDELIEDITYATVLTTTINDCPEIQCPVTVCNYGHKKDENGCNTCDCLKNPNVTDQCISPNCHACFYGSFTDVNGCESCACKPRPKPKSIYECPKLECPSCNYGSIKDEYGCETCICIRPNSVEPSYQCSAIPTCPYGSCKHGSILNDFGCPTCDCLKSVDPDRLECLKEKCQPCQHGYFTDSDGCETCMCKPEWMAPCGQVEITCDFTRCKHGTYLDRNGCPSCECLPDPSISTMTCFEMQETNGQTECNNDGTFKSKQCNDQECRCVTKDGIPISDFKASYNESQYMNCECALALYDVSAFKAIGFKLYCASNGNYEIIQCVGSSCACVNEHGDPLGPSVPIYQKHLLRCEGVFQQVYHDQYLTTIAPTTLTPPLCIYHREQAQEMSNIDIHMSIPDCDDKGLYEPLQCDRQKKYCWCVNIHNGVELNGSRRTGQIPDCTN